MIIEPEPGHTGEIAAKLLAAADGPDQVRTVTGDRGVAYEVPEELAAAAGLLPDAAAKPKRAPRKTAPKTAGEADTNQ